MNAHEFNLLEQRVTELEQLIHTPNTYTAAQKGRYWLLTSSSASIAIDLQRSNNFKHTMTENTTLAAPTNASAGQAGIIEITQASSAKTLAFNSFWKWPGGSAGTLTATNGAKDIISYVVDSTAAFATCVMVNDVK